MCNLLIMYVCHSMFVDTSFIKLYLQTWYVEIFISIKSFHKRTQETSKYDNWLICKYIFSKATELPEVVLIKV